MGPESLSRSLDQPTGDARELLRLHRQTYPVFWRWSEAAVNHAMLRGWLQTVFGWRVQVGPRANPRSLANFPMQANGAEMLRLACCLATECGVIVCAPVHDALLVEGPADEIQGVVAETQRVMVEASRVVLSGFELRSDAKVVSHPDRYTDPRGERHVGDGDWFAGRVAASPVGWIGLCVLGRGGNNPDQIVRGDPGQNIRGTPDKSSDPSSLISLIVVSLLETVMPRMDLNQFRAAHTGELRPGQIPTTTKAQGRGVVLERTNTGSVVDRSREPIVPSAAGWTGVVVPGGREEQPDREADEGYVAAVRPVARYWSPWIDGP